MNWIVTLSTPIAPPSMAWEYLHKDYDGPEDHRHGFAASAAECEADILERFGEVAP